jgi:hypothetical protein
MHARSIGFVLFIRAAAIIRKLPLLTTSFPLCAFRLFAKPEVPLTLLLLCIVCRWCGLQFCVCRRCWRGQAYCCYACRREGKRKSHRNAQRKYRQTEKGKKTHRESENRRRQGQHQQKRKNMDDATSTPRRPWAMKIINVSINLFWHTDIDPVCHFCGAHGRIVVTFPRRGYG